MKIAIMGAGISGLACAITLEKFGITPTIFESRRQVGDRFVNGEILLSALYGNIQDTISFFSENHNIYLRPIANIKKLIIRSENEMATINGSLGFINIRGRDDDSFDQQLFQQLKTKIHFKSKYTYEQLVRDFTHVILATGDAAYTSKIQKYQLDLTVTLRGAIVTGKFNRYTVMAWLDNRFAPKGYAYLIPLSENEANLVIGIPDYPENKIRSVESLWNTCHEQVSENIDQELKIKDQFEVNEYMIGLSENSRIGNTYFTGNCFGAIMPFLGFGQVASLLTGIYAAHDLLGFGKYANLTKRLRSSYQQSLVLRRNIEKLNNSQLDIIVRNLNGTIGHKLFNSKHINFLRLASYLLKPITLKKF